MQNLTKLILDLLHTAKAKGKPLKFEDILNPYVPEQIRDSTAIRNEVTEVLKRLIKSKIVIEKPDGYCLKR